MLGENIACRFLVRQKFKILQRNYRKKWGELDIIGFKDGVLHFFEVKSVTYIPADDFDPAHTPEENVNGFKMRQIRRMISTFLAETGRGAEFEFRFHVLSVFMDLEVHRARVKWIKDVIL